jgi:GPH family glycoside/pentoside/hexuronide:cation symporter
VFIAGLILFLAGTIGFTLSAPARTPMIVFNTIRGFGYGMNASVSVGITAEIIMDIKQRTGKLVAGIGNAGITTAQKLGRGLSTVLFGFGMALAGFDGARDVQPDSVIPAVTALYVWIPAALFVAVLVIFWLGFDLEKKENEQPEQ